MKKLLRSMLITILFLILLIPAATAEGAGNAVFPVLPNGFPELSDLPAEPEEILLYPQTSEISASSVMDLTVSVSQEGTIEAGMTWTASASGGDGNYTYEFTLSIPEIRDGVVIGGETYDGIKVNVVQAKQEYSTADTFRHEFTKTVTMSCGCGQRMETTIAVIQFCTFPCRGKTTL